MSYKIITSTSLCASWSDKGWKNYSIVISKRFYITFSYISHWDQYQIHIFIAMYSIWIVTTGKNEITWKVNYKIKSNVLKECCGVHCALIHNSVHLDVPFPLAEAFWAICIDIGACNPVTNENLQCLQQWNQDEG